MAMKFKAGSAMRKGMKGKRITVKQKAARRKNIAIARKYRKKGVAKKAVVKKVGVKKPKVKFGKGINPKYVKRATSFGVAMGMDAQRASIKRNKGKLLDYALANKVRKLSSKERAKVRKIKSEIKSGEKHYKNMKNFYKQLRKREKSERGKY